jgi:Ca2+-binding EF-hand superfamily protein
MLTFLAALLISSVAIAGHHYGGHGHMMPSWNMTEMDTDQDGFLTFDEFSDTYQKKLRGDFDMIDENEDGLIDKDEWTKLMEVHGVMTN